MIFRRFLGIALESLRSLFDQAGVVIVSSVETDQPHAVLSEKWNSPYKHLLNLLMCKQYNTVRIHCKNYFRISRKFLFQKSIRNSAQKMVQSRGWVRGYPENNFKCKWFSFSFREFQAAPVFISWLVFLSLYLYSTKIRHSVQLFFSIDFRLSIEKIVCTFLKISCILPRVGQGLP